MSDIRRMVEDSIGIVSDDEYEKALPYAKRKLQDINERYGTSHGDAYLSILVEETIRANLFSEFCREVSGYRTKKGNGSQYHAVVPTPVCIL